MHGVLAGRKHPQHTVQNWKIVEGRINLIKTFEDIVLHSFLIFNSALP